MGQTFPQIHLSMDRSAVTVNGHIPGLDLACAVIGIGIIIRIFPHVLKSRHQLEAGAGNIVPLCGPVKKRAVLIGIQAVPVFRHVSW